MFNVLELEAVLGLNDENFESGISNAGDKTEGLSAKTVAMGKIMADAFEAVIGKVIDYGNKIVDVGAQQETALAKVNTIMDTSVMNTTDMSNAIKNLSSEMGVSVTELSDTVYNAISATGDTANAVGLAEKASKLAAAGFTDTSSALSVLTTAMNAYGLSADEATSISDSLIQVQNLGVTTVAELSSSMGKAIASASAYGVDPGNLESAYVSITKAGINTAEGTTYISSMLKELGDSGTDVSKILKEKTGQSFDQMMNDGKTLGDVLGVLNDAVDGDATALMNLWSSAEAGKASSAIVGQGLDEFNNNLKQITETAGTTETAYETMADTMEHKMAVMSTNMENMMADIFVAIEPIISNVMSLVESEVMPMLEEAVDKIEEFAPIIEEKINVAIQTVGQIIDEVVKPAIKWVIDNMDILVPILAAVGGGFLALQVVTGIINAIAVAQGILNAVMAANPIGLLVIAIAALIAGLVTAYKTNEEFREKVDAVWSKVKEIISGVVEAITTFFTQTIPEKIDALIAFFEGIPQWFSELPSRLAYSFGYAVGAVIDWIDWMAHDVIPTIGPKVIEAIMKFFNELPSKIATAFTNVITKFKDFISDLGERIATEVPKLIIEFISWWDELPNKIMDIGKNIVEGLWNGIKNAWSSLVENVTGLFGDLVAGIKDGLDIHSPSRVFASIGSNMALGIGEGWDDEFGDIKKSITSDFDFEATPITNSPQTNTNNLLVDFIEALNSQQTNVTVVLEGDARQLFKAMQTEATIYNTRTGSSAFA